MADLNPQAKQMADESMVRNLDAQARAIWPQEMPLFKRYGLPANAQILDAGCGTGELASRLAELFPTDGVQSYCDQKECTGPDILVVRGDMQLVECVLKQYQ